MNRESSSKSSLPSTPRSGWKSQYSSEHGPHGPVGPAAQKLSASSMRLIRFSGMPISSRQIAYASSSSLNTLIQIRDASRPYSFVEISHAHAMASFLK
eukprot:30980-Pelagococcus_subviridis.AAC.38